MNQAELRKELVIKRASLRLSLRKLTKLTGVSVSTLSRFERGEELMADTFLLLLEWVAPVQGVAVNTLNEIDSLLSKDQRLTTEDARMLSDLVRAGYGALTAKPKIEQLPCVAEKPEYCTVTTSESGKGYVRAVYPTLDAAQKAHSFLVQRK